MARGEWDKVTFIYRYWSMTEQMWNSESVICFKWSLKHYKVSCSCICFGIYTRTNEFYTADEIRGWKLNKMLITCVVLDQCLFSSFCPQENTVGLAFKWMV